MQDSETSLTRPGRTTVHVVTTLYILNGDYVRLHLRLTTLWLCNYATPATQNKMKNNWKLKCKCYLKCELVWMTNYIQWFSKIARIIRKFAGAWLRISYCWDNISIIVVRFISNSRFKICCCCCWFFLHISVGNDLMPLLTKATHSHTHNHSARNITKQKIINSTHSTYTKSLFTKRNQNAKRTNANEKKKINM